MAEHRKPNIPQIVIKKYANRRLYNTSTSTYVTLEDLCDMVKKGIDFGVYDAKTAEDLTQQVLTQIIMEQEAKGGILPVSFLRNLISFYGGNMQMPVAKFLEDSMMNFMANQERIQRQWNETLGTMFPGVGATLEMSKHNMAMMEKAMRMMNPFVENGKPHGQENGTRSEADYNKLKQQLDEIQKQLHGMQPKNKK